MVPASSPQLQILINKMLIKNNHIVFHWAALFVISILYNLPLMQSDISILDEGQMLAGADRILKGHLPYKDFWAVYAPGGYYTLALLFKIFGSSLVIERIYDILIKSIMPTINYLVGRELGISKNLSVLSSALLLIWIGRHSLSIYPVYASMLYLFISIYFFLRYLNKHQDFLLIYCGFFMTASAFYRPDFAGLVAPVILIALIIRKRTDPKLTYRPIFYYISTALLTGLPIAIWFSYTVGFQLMINQLIISPADLMANQRWLPYPISLSLGKIQYSIFPLILATGFVWSLIKIVKYKTHDTFTYGMFTFSLAGILLLSQARVRSDSIHLFPAAMACTVVIPVLLNAIRSQLPDMLTPKVNKRIFYIFVFLIVVSFYRPFYIKLKELHYYNFSASTTSVLARSGYARVDKDLEEVVLYIKNNTHKSEAIYVGAKNHDKVSANDPLIYYLAEREYGTKYHELHPGVTDTSSVQREMIEEFETKSPRMIILGGWYWYEPNLSSVDSKVELLDDYLLENYTFHKKFGVYEVWIRQLEN